MYIQRQLAHLRAACLQIERVVAAAPWVPRPHPESGSDYIPRTQRYRYTVGSRRPAPLNCLSIIFPFDGLAKRFYYEVEASGNSRGLPETWQESPFRSFSSFSSWHFV